MWMSPDTLVAESTTFGPPCDGTGSSLRGMSESTLPDIDSASTLSATPRAIPTSTSLAWSDGASLTWSAG